MSDYTPSTDEVRQVWADSQDMTWDEGLEFHGAEFDRWLASVKAEAWAEGYRAGGSFVRRSWSDEPGLAEPANPYREESK